MGVGVLGIEAREVTGLSSHRPRGFADHGHHRLRIVDFLLFFLFSFFPADAVKVLGRAGGGVPPAQRSSPLINLVGGGAPCPSTTAKCYTLYGWDGSALA